MAMIAVHRNAADEQDGEREDEAGRIVRAAVELAEQRGWERVELTEVARRLDMPAAQVLDHFRDLDAVANAWFLRGWRAMLADKPEDFATWTERQRIEHCMLAWFETFAEHRQVTVEMLKTKAHLPHLHTWVPMIFDLSRTIQWLREAARLEAPYGTRRAQLEEVALTALFLATLKVWKGDDSPDRRETRRFLRRSLMYGKGIMRVLARRQTR